LLGYFDPMPVLVVEIVSPGEAGSPNYDRDYIEKPQEYADRGIPECWIIDPARSVMVVLTLQGKQYQEARLQGKTHIISAAFPSFNLTADNVLNAGR
jgi:Uma2 family endonuclease